MSSALAIAGVSAVLRDLLNDGLINNDATGSLGTSVLVSVGPPDRVIPTNGATETTQLNLFMYQVTPNTGWRNEGLPSRDSSGSQRLSNPPLALNLHYLISAHASEDFHSDILLGYAMQLLHETPVFSRKAIRKALNPSPVVDPALPSPPPAHVLPSALRSLADSGLENQIEQIKITPEYLNTEEMSRLWTATQSHLRPAAAYMASVVLIQAKEAARSSLPVLARGGVHPTTHREKGIVAQPDLLPPYPMLEAVVPDSKQPMAQMGASVELQGHHLDAKPGTAREVRLSNDRFEIEESIPASDPPVPPKSAATSLAFAIADTNANANAFPVGVYSVSAELTPSNEDRVRETNRLAMILAPTINDPLPSVTRDGSGTASFTIDFSPALRDGQKAVLILGQQEFMPESPASFPVQALDFIIPNAPASPPEGFLARLRIDGIESPVIDRSTTPPAFLDKRVVIT